MEEENKKNWIKNHKMNLFFVVVAIIMLIGFTYAWLNLTLRGKKELMVTTIGSLDLKLDDSMEGGISLSSALPMKDEDGLTLEGYTFTLENKGNSKSDYTIYLDDLDLTAGESRMKDYFIKYQLVKDGEEIGFDLLNSIGENPNRLLDSGTIVSGEKYTYTLKMWIDNDATNAVMGTVFKGQLRVEAIQNMRYTLSGKVMKKVNPVTLAYTDATEEQQKEMFTFTHKVGEQQAGWSEKDLTDYRYIGVNPNNYVMFNNELWRIIGLFTVEDEKGKKERRVKIIKNESIGGYAWDNRGSTGINNWSDGALQQVLNSGAYYNKESGTCPYGTYGATTPCDFSSNGLTSEAKSMIAKTKWYLGMSSYRQGTNTGNNANTASLYYTEEKSLTSDNSSIPTSWTGEVGLMYASDYGYATSESSCLDIELGSYGDHANCFNTNWLFSGTNEWLINPIFTSKAGVLWGAGNVSRISPISDYYYKFRPSVYLKSDIRVSKGTGTNVDPYILVKGS